MAKYKLLDGKKIKLTDEEEKLLEANAKEFAKINDAQKKIEEETNKNKDSGKKKLKDLGLTDDEITALIGG
tara:strand:- start:840 stop:1052 length:213 start_codon:yes stop_codon:yes gene_type:complete